jgi:DNA-directed RNA polymerase subunit RPC12/RpoP
MAVRCPDCGREYDVALFQFGKRIRCSCGRVFSLEEANIIRKDEYDFLRDLCHEIEVSEEDKRVRRIQLEADRICQMILDKSYQAIDIEIAKEKLYNLCLELFPDKIHLYDLIFEPRFKRLWEQFRQEEGS